MYCYLSRSEKGTSKLRRGRFNMSWGERGRAGAQWSFLSVQHCYGLSAWASLDGEEQETCLHLAVPLLFSIYFTFARIRWPWRTDRCFGASLDGIEGWGPWGSLSLSFDFAHDSMGGQSYSHDKNRLKRWWANFNGHDVGWSVRISPWGLLLGRRMCETSIVPVTARRLGDEAYVETRRLVEEALSIRSFTGKAPSHLIPRCLDEGVSVDDVAFGAVLMPEGAYLTMTHFVRYKRWLSRWPFWPLNRDEIGSTTDVLEPGGIPFPGKGESAHDCGIDGVYSYSCDAEGEREAMDRLQASVLESRRRHGGDRMWMPPKEPACASE